MILTVRVTTQPEGIAEFLSEFYQLIEDSEYQLGNDVHTFGYSDMKTVEFHMSPEGLTDVLSDFINLTAKMVGASVEMINDGN